MQCCRGLYSEVNIKVTLCLTMAASTDNLHEVTFHGLLLGARPHSFSDFSAFLIWKFTYQLRCNKHLCKMLKGQENFSMGGDLICGWGLDKVAESRAKATK